MRLSVVAVCVCVPSGLPFKELVAETLELSAAGPEQVQNMFKQGQHSPFPSNITRVDSHSLVPPLAPYNTGR